MLHLYVLKTSGCHLTYTDTSAPEERKLEEAHSYLWRYTKGAKEIKWEWSSCNMQGTWMLE